MSVVRDSIRPAEADDAGGVAAIYAPIVRNTPISFELDPPDANEMRRRIERTVAMTPWLVCTKGTALAGYAYATGHRERAAYRWSVDVSVYVHEAARGRGVAAGLYEALLGILRIQGFHRAYAGITLPNAASVGLHESASFRPVGVYRSVGFKCGAWHDVGWWERALVEASDSPAEPVPFHQIVHTPDIVAACATGLARVRDLS
jgi:phosphinothricin acetyltransferase